MQVGEGEFVPRHLPHERFVPHLRKLYAKSSLVIAHGGAATTFEVLRAGVPLVSVANPDRYDDHQTDLLEALSEAGHLTWCRDLVDLEEAVDAALAGGATPLPDGTCSIGSEVVDYVTAISTRRPWLDRLRLRHDRHMAT